MQAPPWSHVQIPEPADAPNRALRHGAAWRLGGAYIAVAISLMFWLTPRAPVEETLAQFPLVAAPVPSLREWAEHQWRAAAVSDGPLNLRELLSRTNIAASRAASAGGDSTARPHLWFPTDGWLTSTFQLERMHPIYQLRRPHDGIDIAAPWGAPIVTLRAGRVVSVGWQSGYGNVLAIDHGGGVVTKYAHCSKILVRAGQFVAADQPVALVGSTGLSTGPHVHYEILINDRYVDPATFAWRGRDRENLGS